MHVRRARDSASIAPPRLLRSNSPAVSTTGWASNRAIFRTTEARSSPSAISPSAWGGAARPCSAARARRNSEYPSRSNTRQNRLTVACDTPAVCAKVRMDIAAHSAGAARIVFATSRCACPSWSSWPRMRAVIASSLIFGPFQLQHGTANPRRVPLPAGARWMSLEGGVSGRRIDAGEERDERYSHRTLRRIERRPRPFLAHPARLSQDPYRADAEFLVRWDHVDHEVAVRLPQPDHRRRREGVEHHFLRRRCLEAGGTGEHLGPGVRQNRDVGERGERGGRVGGDEDRRDSPARRSGESTDRKSTRLNSSHVAISYAVFCLKKKKIDMRKGTSTRWTTET